MSQVVTAALVKELRERTSGGMLECKKALDASGGDIEAAIDAMRTSGQAKAAKKSGRIAAEGVIVICVSEDRKAAFMAEVNCETDFVARDESFKKFADMLVKCGLKAGVDNVEKLLALRTDTGKTVAEAREELVVKIGENIQVRRVVLMQSENHIAHYLHGARIGVLVNLSVDNDELGKDIAMHIVASSPQFVSDKDVAAAVIEREKAIYLAQAIESGKPQAIAEKMVTGRLQKFLGEITLLGQPFVKNPDITVETLLKNQKAEVKSFVRFAVGEGIEKETTDFAAEVAAQVRK
ncbi:MAG: translation elongation factor Ts [Gammaproteobacteria bacterium GWE2_37_16]|nr:MAG: translation elongation factor Ts [Gammaproteobacteria bacterium GWE2_37_16]